MCRIFRFAGAGDRMNLAVREMTFAETRLVLEYFASATPEYLDMMGVDPNKLMPQDQWRARLETEFDLPHEKRQWFAVIWLLNGGAGRVLQLRQDNFRRAGKHASA